MSQGVLMTTKKMTSMVSMPLAPVIVTHQLRLINMKAGMRSFENKEVGLVALLTTIITKPFLVNPNLLPGPIYWRLPPSAIARLALGQSR
jgi:hypothetical protein